MYLWTGDTTLGPQRGPVRILVIDDDPTVRRALREALERGEDVASAGEVTTGAEAVSSVETIRPDVVVIEARVPQVDGVTAALRIASLRAPRTSVLVLAAHHDDDLALLALRAGAAGFLAKDAGPDAIVRAAHGLALGEAALTRRMTRRLVEEMRALFFARRRMRPAGSSLTSREWDVLELLSEGATTQQIADDLVLSSDTVRTHVKHILRKLRVHSRAEAVHMTERLRSSTGPSGEPLLDEIELRRQLRAVSEAAHPPLL